MKITTEQNEAYAEWATHKRERKKWIYNVNINRAYTYVYVSCN